MPRKKKFTPKSALKEPTKRVVDSDDSNEDSDDFDDEVQHFDNKKHKHLLQTSALAEDTTSDEDNYASDDEIMPLDDNTDDDEEEDEENNDNRNEFVDNRFGIELKKDEMASDLEDSDEEQMDSNAWGKTKNLFYNTDYVDKDFRRYNHKDSDQALYEEEEALAIQKRLFESINETDVGIELLVGDIEPKKTSLDETNGERDENEEKLQINFSNLTQREKLEILRKESPELEPLITDFRCYMTELKDRLLPILQVLRKQHINLTALKYLETRYHIVINYCVNICFYMSLKCQRIDIKEHPVLKQIIAFKKLLTEINSITTDNSNSIDKEMDIILQKSMSNEKIKLMKKRKKKPKTVENDRKKVKFSNELNETKVSEKTTNLINIYDNNEEQETNDLTKRGITYEMAKNKGLTAKRKKELRNPRVKHRMKFRKANIRRKGQVRETRKELQRYGGELSGIKSSVIKSVKFK
ncbi:something about silencing protein 10-like [Oppia nitens]|uniref:something about silencing protein 10-like n=1 Tax=Oppia nitens TaxID=1686743 RepID=UPI0023D9FB00|nr:something about silencing protein 10-like [Oppia nitens]